MVIGGCDLIYKTQLSVEDQLITIKCLLTYVWGSFVTEKFQNKENDLFIYKNMESRESWEKHGANPQNENLMVNVIANVGELSLVVGSETDRDMKMLISMVETFMHPAYPGKAFVEEKL